MSTPKEIYWALSRRRDPKMVAATVEAKALGIKIEGGWEAGINSVMIDAADAIGCRPEDLDINREHHLNVLSDAMREMIQDYIDAHPATTDSSQSSLTKKAP